MVAFELMSNLYAWNGTPREGATSANAVSFPSRTDKDYTLSSEPKQGSSAPWETAWIDIGGES